MKLDSRILEGKKPLDCFDVDIAKQFIGHEGYFCDHRSGFTNIYNLVKDVLRDITPDDNYCEVYKTNCTSWEYFLPEEWIKEPEEPEEPEKKYRPYTADEFIDKFEFWIGRVIRVRDKKSEYTRTQYEYKTVFTGYRQCIGGIEVFLNGKWYTMHTLLGSFEYMENNEWQPFGVIDEGVGE